MFVFPNGNYEVRRSPSQTFEESIVKPFCKESTDQGEETNVVNRRITLAPVKLLNESLREMHDNVGLTTPPYPQGREGAAGASQRESVRSRNHIPTGPWTLACHRSAANPPRGTNDGFRHQAMVQSIVA